MEAPPPNMPTASDLFRAEMSQLRDVSESRDAAEANFQELNEARKPAEVGEEGAQPLESAEAPQTGLDDAVSGDDAPEGVEREPVSVEASNDPPEAAPETSETSEAGETAEEAGDLVEMADGTRIPVAELVRGHLREADYTRKTQELADHRKEFDQQAQAVAANAQQGMEHLQHLSNQLQEQLNKNQPTAQQLEALKQRDPVAYTVHMEEQRQQRELLNVANQQAENIRQHQLAQVIPQQRALLAQSVPAFAKDFDTEYHALGQYATSPEGGGLSREEWDQLVDHRHVTLVYKAQQYDKAARSTSRLPKKLPSNTPKVLRPGVTKDTGDTASEGYAAALARQAESGDVRNTADAFRAMEGLRRRRAR